MLHFDMDRYVIGEALRGNDLTVTYLDIVDRSERIAEFFSQNAAEDFIQELGNRFVSCNFERSE